MTAGDTRNEALMILREVVDSGSFIQDAVRTSDLPGKGARELDVRFILNLVRGTAERKTILEAVLRKLVNQPLRKMKPLLRLIFLLGLYEILFMDGKSYAAVNEYVELAKRKGFQGLSGFVNAVLRRAAREKDTLTEGLTEEERSGLPGTVFRTVCDNAGRDRTLAFGKYVLSEASKRLTIRRNVSAIGEDAFIRALKEDGAAAIPLDLSDYPQLREAASEDLMRENEIYVLQTDKTITSLVAFQKGFFYVQDVSAWSAFRSLESALSPENAVLDLCAAPGGKTFQLMDMARKTGIQTPFTACDISAKRLRRMQENAARMGFTELEFREMDATQSCADFTDSFGLVVADVPCSGIGDLSGKPEIRFHVTDAAIKELSAIQRNILLNAASYVKPSGMLQYSTCTLTRSENQDQVRAFLQERTDFRLLLEKTLIPGVNTPGDGFYYARFTRKTCETKE